MVLTYDSIRVKVVKIKENDGPFSVVVGPILLNGDVIRSC